MFFRDIETGKVGECVRLRTIELKDKVKSKSLNPYQKLPLKDWKIGESSIFSPCGGLFV